MASSAPAATEAGRNGPGYRARPSSTWIAGLDLGVAQPAELLRDRTARQAQFARQPGVQVGSVAGLAVQRATQFSPRQLVGEDGAQGVMAGVLVFAEVNRVPNRHEKPLLYARRLMLSDKALTFGANPDTGWRIAGGGGRTTIRSV